MRKNNAGRLEGGVHRVCVSPISPRLKSHELDEQKLRETTEKILRYLALKVLARE